MKKLESYVNNQTDFLFVRFDPVVNHAVKYAIVDNLIVQLKNVNYMLTEKGTKFIEIIESAAVLEKEKSFLNKLGTKLTNKKLEQLLKLWRLKNAKN